MPRGVPVPHLPVRLREGYVCQECLCRWPCLEFQTAVPLKHAHPLSQPPEVRPEEPKQQ